MLLGLLASRALVKAMVACWRAWGRSWPLAMGSWPCSVRAGRPPRFPRPSARPAPPPARAERGLPQHHRNRRCPMPLCSPGPWLPS
jgi:hypothetical protein